MKFQIRTLFFLLFTCSAFNLYAQNYSGCVITGVDYAIRTDFPVYEIPDGTSITYAESGCSPAGATNMVAIYQNSSSSGNIGSRCYNISPAPAMIKNCKVVVSGIGRCGYIAGINFVPCALDKYVTALLLAIGLLGFWVLKLK